MNSPPNTLRKSKEKSPRKRILKKNTNFHGRETGAGTSTSLAVNNVVRPDTVKQMYSSLKVASVGFRNTRKLNEPAIASIFDDLPETAGAQFSTTMICEGIVRGIAVEQFFPDLQQQHQQQQYQSNDSLCLDSVDPLSAPVFTVGGAVTFDNGPELGPEHNSEHPERAIDYDIFHGHFYGGRLYVTITEVCGAGFALTFYNTSLIVLWSSFIPSTEPLRQLLRKWKIHFVDSLVYRELLSRWILQCLTISIVNKKVARGEEDEGNTAATTITAAAATVAAEQCMRVEIGLGLMTVAPGPMTLPVDTGVTTDVSAAVVVDATDTATHTINSHNDGDADVARLGEDSSDAEYDSDFHSDSHPDPDPENHTEQHTDPDQHPDPEQHTDPKQHTEQYTEQHTEQHTDLEQHPEQSKNEDQDTRTDADVDAGLMVSLEPAGVMRSQAVHREGESLIGTTDDVTAVDTDYPTNKVSGQTETKVNGVYSDECEMATIDAVDASFAIGDDTERSELGPETQHQQQHHLSAFHRAHAGVNTIITAVSFDTQGFRTRYLSKAVPLVYHAAVLVQCLVRRRQAVMRVAGIRQKIQNIQQSVERAHRRVGRRLRHERRKGKRLEGVDDFSMSDSLGMSMSMSSSYSYSHGNSYSSSGSSGSSGGDGGGNKINGRRSAVRHHARSNGSNNNSFMSETTSAPAPASSLSPGSSLEEPSIYDGNDDDDNKDDDESSAVAAVRQRHNNNNITRTHQQAPFSNTASATTTTTTKAKLNVRIQHPNGDIYPSTHVHSHAHGHDSRTVAGFRTQSPTHSPVYAHAHQPHAPFSSSNSGSSSGSSSGGHRNSNNNNTATRDGRKPGRTNAAVTPLNKPPKMEKPPVVDDTEIKRTDYGSNYCYNPKNFYKSTRLVSSTNSSSNASPVKLGASTGLTATEAAEVDGMTE